MENKATHLLEVTDLYTSFNIPAGEVRSVNGVSFTLDKGKVLGIVGESGSGKSVTAYSIMQILQHPGRVSSGSIKFNGQELLNLSNEEMSKIRGSKISIIFQDPMSSLNPVYTIGNQIKESIRLHPVERIVKPLDEELANTARILQDAKAKFVTNKNDENKKNYREAKEKYLLAKKNRECYEHNHALEMLKLVGINEPEKRLKQYPFELSGGMLQRIMIAMSLVCEPDLLIADEPTTALDVTIQAQILELLKDLQKKMGMGIIIITHDLGVVAQICDEVDVMYAGRIVERGVVDEIFYNPQHEYTKGLMKSIPQINETREKLDPIDGNPVDVFCLPKGCSFAPRCASCMKICLDKYPARVAVNDQHETSCFKFIVDACRNNDITNEELNEIIARSTEENISFRRVSAIDVLIAHDKYISTVAMYNDILLNYPAGHKQRVLIRKRKRVAKNNYLRVKSNYRLSIRDYKNSRRELPSTEQDDINHHVKEAKKRIKYSLDALVDKNGLFDHLTKLRISSYQVDNKFHREDVNAAKKAYEDSKEKMKLINKNDHDAKIEALLQTDKLKKIYEAASDKYARNRRIIRQTLKAQELLVKVNERRVKKTIRQNAYKAYKKFRKKHLMFANQNVLDQYLNNFIYTHWDFDPTLTIKKLIQQYNDWQNTQKDIYAVRAKSDCENVDELIKSKNLAMLKFWFSRSDYNIFRCYKQTRTQFELTIRRLNKLNQKRSRALHRKIEGNDYE